MIGFIKAKDAARHSGYTQDYIGQLIRRGKIAGKKMNNEWYLNIFSFIRYVQLYNPEIKLKFNPTLLFACKYRRTAIALVIILTVIVGTIGVMLVEPYRALRQLEGQVIETNKNTQEVRILSDGNKDSRAMEITSLPDDAGGVFISVDETQ